MRLLFLTLLFLLITILLFAEIPTEQNLRAFLGELNNPIALTVNGGNFNSSFYLAGIPHFNIETGISSLGFRIKDPVGMGTIKTNISMFHLKGSFGLFKGFSPTHSWKGFLGLETGVKGFTSPLLGALNQYKEQYPFGFSVTTKLNLLKNSGFIPSISFSFDYSYLFDGKLKFIDRQTNEKASCSFHQNNLYYHFAIRENLGLVHLYTGFGWLSPTLKADYVIEENEGALTSEPGTLNKFYFGLTVPVELIDINLEFGKSQSYGYYGAALGFRM